MNDEAEKRSAGPVDGWAHAKKMSKGGMACTHCGGFIDDDGFAKEMAPDDSGEHEIGNDGMPDDRAAGASIDVKATDFSEALKRRGGR